MRTHLINLARRPDRLEAMTRQLDALGIAFERFDAVDAQSADPAWMSALFCGGPLGKLSAGDMACTCSHAALWRRIAAGTDSHAAILEDDVRLYPDAAKFLGGAAWVPPEAGVVKLERYGDVNQLVVVGRRGREAFGREVAPLYSRHVGGGGYVIAREAAALLGQMTRKIAVPVDQLLFNPGCSPVFDALKPWQLLPAVLEQHADIGGGTDIRRKRETTFAQRLSRRLGNARALAGQIALAAAGKARVVKIAAR